MTDEFTAASELSEAEKAEKLKSHEAELAKELDTLLKAFDKGELVMSVSAMTLVDFLRAELALSKGLTEAKQLVINRLEAEISTLRASQKARVDEGWNDPDLSPPVKHRSYDSFIVAVYRKHSDKIYTFCADYLNQYPLAYDDGHTDLNDDEGLRPTTGWFDHSSNFEYDDLWNTLSFGDGDKMVGWREVPDWPLTRPTPTAGEKASPSTQQENAV